VVKAMGAAAATASLPAMGRRARAGSPGPNFVVIVTDDQRADTLGVAGHPFVQTPAIDALAAAGTYFEHSFVTTSICAVSRASILTGQYMRRHRLRDFATPLSGRRMAKTYPVQLRRAGYRTSFVGKWGLGGALPKRSFDDFNGFTQHVPYRKRGQPHLTQRLADSAIRFLERGAANGPFCLVVQFLAPHGPWQHYDRELEDLYADEDIDLHETEDRDAARRLPRALRKTFNSLRTRKERRRPEVAREKVRGYLRLVTGVDRAVGRILAALDATGCADDTVVLFASDNGMLLGEHALWGKWLMLEESIRVPLIVRDPRIPAQERVARQPGMALNIDIAPTVLSMAGVEPPERMQGRDLSPLLRLGAAGEWRQDWYYEHNFQPPSGRIAVSTGVRTETHKYIRYGRGREEQLYDLIADPEELEDLSDSSAHAALLGQLRTPRRSELRAEAR
jgi:arylsulfatase A-like enzyme